MDANDQKEFQKQAAEMLEKIDIDTDVHHADMSKSGESTLCVKQIPPAKTSVIDKEITCPNCRGKLNWRAL